MTLDALIRRAWAVRCARDLATDDPEAEFAAGVLFAVALLLERESAQRAGDVREAEEQIARLCDSHPWIRSALELAGDVGRVEVC